MNPKEAESLARKFLSESLIRLHPCEEAPASRGYCIGGNPDDYYYFVVDFVGEPSHVGASRYVAVSKTTGEVAYMGRIGE